MSLAGLDTPAVLEAYHASIAEPSGWYEYRSAGSIRDLQLTPSRFLLQHEAGSRDTVELMKRGSGGVSEVCTAIDSYTEKSPLYGLIQFRRRKIVLKYVPEGTSRLVQGTNTPFNRQCPCLLLTSTVRLTVQFQSVLDAFTPHDTVYAFATAHELTESDLAMAIMRLPPNNSLTSSSSSARHRLNEISEDVEDVPDKKEPSVPETQEVIAPQIPEPQSTQPAVTPPQEKMEDLDELPASALRAKALLSRRKDMEASPEPVVAPTPITSPEPVQETAPPPVSKDNLAPSTQASLPSPGIDKDLPAIPQLSPTAYVLPEITPQGEGTPASDSRPSLSISRLEHHRQISTADSDSIQEWTNNVAAFSTIKPKKKKLAPRPHVEGPSRPQTSGNSEAAARIRPVANLPTSIRVTNTRPNTSATNRPGSQQSSKSVPGRFPPPESPIHIMPPLPSPTHIASMYRPVSRASRASVTTENANVTPEKMRLMKALQMRKKNMLVAQRTSASTAASHAPSESLASTNTTATNLEPVENKALLSSSTASPTTVTNLSEVPSKASSRTSNEVEKRRGSLSSDTSSSITPKAGLDTGRKQKSPKNSPSTDAPTLPEKQRMSPLQSLIPLSVETNSQSQQSLLRESSLSSNASRTKRGRPVPEYLKISSNVSEHSDEDSLMDELENATVQEAKPVSVARTPVTPVMSKVTTFNQSARSVSTPTQTRPVTQPHAESQARSQSSESVDKPKSAGGRSISTALPNWPPVPSEPVPLTTKATVGSGISKRIKALEVLSTRTSTSPPRAPVKSEPATRSAFSKFMKRSSQVLDPHSSPNTSTETSPPKKLPEVPPKDAVPMVPQPWVQRQGSATQVFHPTQKGETVSVTARIIRDESDDFQQSQIDPNDIALFQSPLIVEHERQGEGLVQRDITTADSSRSPERERGRFSFSSQRLHTSDSFASKLSLSGTGRKHPPKSPSSHSSITNDEKSGKASRAGRLMKRVSNLTAMRRPKPPGATKSSSSVSQLDVSHYHPATIQEHFEPHSPRKQSVSESLLHVVDIGDVNVQFPESLLWKRRFIRIDDQGFLIFSPPASESNARGVSRKFHLGDFRMPVLPRESEEEMKWSIVLDFVGREGGIVCACESAGERRGVLQSKFIPRGLEYEQY